MSKESRRRQRTSGQPSGTRPGAPTAAFVGCDGRAQPPTDLPTSPNGAPERAGRRERARPAPRRSFIERYRTWLLAAAIVAVVAIVGAGSVRRGHAAGLRLLHASGSRPRRRRPAAGASPQPGYVQPDMGNTHVADGTVVTYTYCPPAAGGTTTARAPGRSPPRLRPERRRHPAGLGPQPRARRARRPLPRRPRRDRGGACARCSTPPGEPGVRLRARRAVRPVIARFDQMAAPFAALVWGRVLPLETLDQAAILDFYATLRRADEPGEALRVAEPVRRARRGRVRGAVGGAIGEPSAAPSASPAAPSGTPAASPS